MIPVFQAIEFKSELVGGSTRPWLITALKDEEPESFVVKLYSEKNNEQNFTVFKECICSLLAREFDLQTPEIALIDFSADFIASLPPRLQEILSTKDNRLKFATRLIKPPYLNFSPSLQENFLQNFDTGTVYAFDNLILNVDRRSEKPNMFFKDGHICLIDHELSLATAGNAYNSLRKVEKWTYNYSRHLFFRYLQQLSDLDKSQLFDTFYYYLSNLVDLSFMPKVYDQLNDCGYSIEDYPAINDYLCEAQSNSKRLVQMIENSLHD